MKNIVIIGAGQLGCRHLQALSMLDIDCKIDVVDISAESLQAANDRFCEMPINRHISSVRYLLTQSDLPASVDLVIIATNSDIRGKVVRELLSLCEVRNIIFEKVLFQRSNDYDEIEVLMRQKGASAWVNHPRRMFPFYSELKTLLAGSNQVSYHVQGGNWGLACNGLHYIDHLAFLTECSELTVDIRGLNPSLLASKRRGFIEVSGNLSGRIGPHTFQLFCHEVSSPVVIAICSDVLNALIDEGSGWARVIEKSGGGQWIEKRQKIVYFQSELSNIFVKDIIDTGRCKLTPYSEAKRLHVPFVGGLLEHINQHSGPQYDACPIT
jgi:hypothetical protein